MGDMFRSELMSLCQLFIQPEAGYASVSLLGELGIAQFRDLNIEMSAFQRKFVSEVRRCEEMERRLRYIGSEVKKDNVTVPELKEMPIAPNPREIINLEANVERTEGEILEMSHNAVNLKSNFMELTELKHVLEKTDAFFQESVSFQQQEGDSVSRALIGDEQASRTQLGFVAGVVPRERVFAFERMLWRISRGNVLLRRADIEEPLNDPSTGNILSKTVFVAFYQGEELKARVKKVCAGFHATLYPCPASSQERLSMVSEVKTRLEDLILVLNQTDDHRQRVLVSVAKELPAWIIMVKKMKAIYHTMNYFNMDVTKKCLIGECWVPTKDLGEVNNTLAEGSKAVGSSIPSFLNVIKSSEEPPTYNRTNNFTQGFQNLIYAYGIASYREVNPALYTIITFPFLFAVMFGDLGHGLILTLFGLWMVVKENEYLKKKSDSEIWNIFFGGRYIIFLMGLFSMYTGLIYNDVFSKSMNIFGSGWSVNYNTSTVMENSQLTLDPSIRVNDYRMYPYPIGIDPVWQLAQNKIIFLNSYKMKISIIFGVLHMIFGVSLSVANHVHYKEKIYIVLEFIPQLVFLLVLFFYLVVLMFLKYFLYSGEYDMINHKRGIHCAPNILITFINMMLMKQPEDKNSANVPLQDRCDLYMYPYQDMVQKLLLAIAAVCIPIMLFGKPIYIIYFKRKNQSHKLGSNGQASGTEMQVLNGTATGVVETEAGPGGEHDNDPPSEIVIIQVIHTVEYVLSTISHTASYLRLWALSLAHGQLSEVLWNMVLKKGIGYDPVIIGGVTLYIIFSFWSFFTVAILVLMEGLSAFLHTLRLHWVEFMSKFYKGVGYPFQPFSLKNILEESEESDLSG